VPTESNGKSFLHFKRSKNNAAVEMTIESFTKHQNTGEILANIIFLVINQKGKDSLSRFAFVPTAGKSVVGWFGCHG
jgi:hypothetical protein